MPSERLQMRSGDLLAIETGAAGMLDPCEPRPAVVIHNHSGPGEELRSLILQLRSDVMATYADLRGQLDEFQQAFARVESNFPQLKTELADANAKLDALASIKDNGTEEEFTAAVEELRALVGRATALVPEAPPPPPVEPPAEPPVEPLPPPPEEPPVEPAPADPNAPQPA